MRCVPRTATSDLKHPTPQSSDLLLESAYASAARSPGLEHMDVKELRQHLQPVMQTPLLS